MSQGLTSISDKGMWLYIGAFRTGRTSLQSKVWTQTSVYFDEPATCVISAA